MASVLMPLAPVVVMAIAVLMPFVIADRAVMMTIPVIVFVQPESAVAVEIFKVAVEREGRAEERELICGAAAESWRCCKRGDSQTDFHE